ncbi:M23 family metallopeptidase [Kitasatospora paranensis]|uniref:M23 family metallopeptidase n=1 Tax=Kitasatospora paranensis TaxID=258053 RepID=A0ABW2FNA3_9ACTN
MPDSDHRAEATALRRFLRADPAHWPQLAPQVVDRVGLERLRRIVDATRDRVGGIREVADGPDGLTVGGPAGHVLAWARLDDEGRLAALLISPARPDRRGLPPPLVRWCTPAAFALLLWLRVVSCWTATDGSGWGGSVLGLTAGYVLYEGYWAAGTDPWWVRRPIEAGALAALGSVWRLPRLPWGDHRIHLMVGAALAVASAVALVRSRRHSWGTATALPLAAFPLRGDWYVGQGGGRGLNHHLAAPEQRGAVDLVQVGSTGTHRGDRRALTSYPAYGAAVHAPCDGQVAAAVDGLPDQAPGVLRYGPLYGNHVAVDTGTETVVLAHLQPGSVAVAVGDRVRTGQFLGRVGNSGNSTEPHLHLHAEREGLGLDLVFADVGGRLHRGRTVRARTANTLRQ